jgi:hypothetical protein
MDLVRCTIYTRYSKHLLSYPVSANMQWSYFLVVTILLIFISRPAVNNNTHLLFFGQNISITVSVYIDCHNYQSLSTGVRWVHQSTYVVEKHINKDKKIVCTVAFVSHHKNISITFEVIIIVEWTNCAYLLEMQFIKYVNGQSNMRLYVNLRNVTNYSTS